MNVLPPIGPAGSTPTAAQNPGGRPTTSGGPAVVTFEMMMAALVAAAPRLTTVAAPVATDQPTPAATEPTTGQESDTETDDHTAEAVAAVFAATVAGPAPTPDTGKAPAPQESLAAVADGGDASPAPAADPSAVAVATEHASATDHAVDVPVKNGAVTLEAMLSQVSEKPSDPLPGTHTERPDTATQPATAQIGLGEATRVSTPGTANPAPVVIPAHTLQRVEEAIRRLESAPPPRAVTLVLDDLNVRVTVAVRPDGVAVTSPTPGTAHLVQSLEQALAGRGFDLAGGEGRHDRRSPEEQPAPYVPTRRPAQRTVSDHAIRL